MNLPISLELTHSDRTLTPSSPQALVKRALAYAWQGNFVEAAISFMLIGDELAEAHPRLAQLINLLALEQIAYRQAQQSLSEATKLLAQVDSQQQSLLKELENLVGSLSSESFPISSGSPPATLENKFREAFPTPALPAEEGESLPPLFATCFGRFEVRRRESPVDLCNNRNGQAILRYLIVQPERRQTMQVLMSVLWPEDEAEVARRKLRVAVSALRRSLNQGYDCPSGEGYILCKNESYQLNSAISIKTDLDEFLARYQAGQQANQKGQTIRHYEVACQLYSGPFLVEDLYADWSFIQREQLNQIFVNMCSTLTDYYLSNARYEAAIHWATRLVGENRFDEVAQRQLMRAYALCGQRSAALKQYQHCKRSLEEELKVQPMPETESLFYAILRGEI